MIDGLAGAIKKSPSKSVSSNFEYCEAKLDRFRLLGSASLEIENLIRDGAPEKRLMPLLAS